MRRASLGSTLVAALLAAACTSDPPAEDDPGARAPSSPALGPRGPGLPAAADGGASPDGVAAEDTRVRRVAGLDAWTTQAAVSARAFAATDHVVVANGTGTVTLDALVGAPLARRLAAPLLTVDTTLPEAVCAELRRLAARWAHVVGGGVVVGDGVTAAFAGCGVPAFDRFNGGSFADTASRVALAVAMGVHGTLAVVGPDPADPAAARYLAPAASLAASLGVPLLVAGRDAVPPETDAVIARLGIRETLVVAPPEVISAGALWLLPEPGRIAGGDPATVAAEAAKRSLEARPGPVEAALVWVAADAVTPDAASAIAAGAILLFAQRAAEGLPEPTAAFLRGNRARIATLVVLGGEENGIPKSAEDEARALLEW